MKTRLLMSLVLSICSISALGCPVCKRQQPKVVSAISHGTGPQNNIDYAIMIGAIFLVVLCLYLSVHYLLSPGESHADHIKREFLKYNS